MLEGASLPGSALSDEIEWLHGSHKEQLRRCAPSQTSMTAQGSLKLMSSQACDALTCRISLDIDCPNYTRQSPLAEPCNHEIPHQQARRNSRQIWQDIDFT